MASLKRPLAPQPLPTTTSTPFSQLHPSLTLLFSHSSSTPLPPSPPRPTPTEPTETYLRTLSTALLQALDPDLHPKEPNPNFAHHRQHLLKTHLHPTLQIEAQRGGQLTSTSAIPPSPLSLPLDPQPQSPSPSFDINSIPSSLRDDISLIDCAVELSSSNRRAKVWLLKCLGNYTFGSNESVTVMDFERRGGGLWVCVRLMVVEGMTECG